MKLAGKTDQIAAAAAKEALDTTSASASEAASLNGTNAASAKP